MLGARTEVWDMETATVAARVAGVVEYDPATGVPAMSSIDYLRYAVDDETGFVLEDFAVSPAVAATPLPSRP